MKLTKSMKYYFVFWIIGIPLLVVTNFLILNGNIESFLGLTGIGALIQLVFLSIRYIVLRNKSFVSSDASCGDSVKLIELKPVETEIVENNAFAEMFSEENKLEVGVT